MRRCFLWLVCLMLWGISESTPAQEIVLESFSGVGARAMGMGGAYVSLSHDFSGIFWNPAGLARVKRGEVHWEVMHNRFENASQFFGSPSAYEMTSTRVGAIGAVIPYPVYQGSLVFAGGFGRNQTFDSGLDLSGYDSVAHFEKTGYSEDRGALGAWTLGGAMDLAPNLSVGVAIYRWRGSNRFAQELTLDDTQSAHPDTVQLYQRFGSRDRYSSWGAQGGLLFLHPSGFRLGLTAMATRPLKVQMDLEDEFKDVFDDRTDTYPRETYQDDYAIQMPFSFGIGVGWTRRALTLSGDLHYGDVQEASYDATPKIIAPNVNDFRKQYRNAVRLHLGAEYAFAQRGLAVRAGYYRDPVRYLGGGTLPAVSIIQEKDAFTLGFGAELAQTAVLDLAAVIGGYQVREGNRDDTVRTVRVLASVRFRFDVEDSKAQE